jgi:hypothetical protein
MIDETTDRNKDKQLVVLARIFDEEKDVETLFLNMPVCNASTAEDLFRAMSRAMR